MEKHIVSDDYTIKEVMEHFEVNHDRVAVIINDDRKVIGIVSQGDIIRAIASGISLYTSIQKIIQPSFLYLKERNMEKAYELFKKKKITLIPIVDEKFNLTGIVNLDDVYDYLDRRIAEEEL